MRKTIATIALLAATSAIAQSGWRDAKGVPLAESESAKTRDNFSVALMITSDEDWQSKWETAPKTVPQFSIASEVENGGALDILTFLANPAIGEDGMTSVSCDLLVTRPDGTVSVEQIQIPCFNHQLTGDPENVYLSAAYLKFTAEATDLRGKWLVNVKVRDNVRGVQIPLSSEFVLK
jgi:hypothetical protein